MPSVLIYTLAGCPFCVRAVALLRSKGSNFTEVDVTRDTEARRAASGRSGHRTFPQIWVGEAFVGGCDELFALERAGRLDAMLA